MSDESTQTQQLEIRVLRAHLRVPIVFLLPVFLLVSVYAGLYLGVNADGTRRAVPGWVNQLLGAGEYEVNELVLGPDLTTVDVYGAEIRVEGASKPTIEAQHAHASLQPLYLLDSRVRFGDSHATGGRVRLEMDESGEMNLLQALGLAESTEAAEPTDERGIAVEFPDLSAEDCEFQYVQPDFEFSVPDVEVPDASLSVSALGELRIDVPALTVPEARFRYRAALFGLEQAKWGDWTFTVADTRVDDWRWRGDGFEVDAVTAYAEGTEVEASGSMAFPATEDAGGTAADTVHMRYEGEATVRMQRWSSLIEYFVEDTVYAEIPSLTVAAEGTLQGIDGGVELQADRVNASGVEMSDVRARLRLQNQYLTLTEGSMSMYGGRVSVSEAYFDMFRVIWGGNAEFEGVDPAAIVSGFGGELEALRGDLAGGLSVHGGVPFDDPTDLTAVYPLNDYAHTELADAEVTRAMKFRPAAGSNWPEEGFRIRKGARAKVDFHRVALGNVRMALPGGMMTLHQAELDYDALVFRSATHSPPVYLTAALTDPEPLTAGLLGVPIGGSASLRMSARGPVTTPSGRLTVEIEEPSAPVDGRRVSGASADVDLQLQAGLLRVNQGRFDSDLGSIRVDGHAELYEKVDTFLGELWRARRRQPLDLSVTVSDLDLGALNSLFEWEWGASGFLSAAVGIGGTVQRPEADGSLEMSSGTFMDATLSGVEVGFSVNGRRAAINHGTFGIGGGRVTGSGAYRWRAGAYEVDLGIRGVQLGALVPIQQRAGRFAPAGRLDATLEGAGTLEQPSLGGSLTWREGKVGEWSLGDTALTVYGGEGAVHVTGAAVSLASLDVEIPTTGDGPMYARLGLKQWELGRRFPEVQRLEAVDRLDVTGAVELFAARDLSTYNVVTRLTDVEVQTPARTFRNRGPLEVAVNHRGVVQFEQFEVGAGDEFVELRGGVRLEPLLLDLRMEGQLDLRLVDVVGPYIIGEGYRQSVGRIEGRAAVDASFRGVPTRPIANGRIDVEGATINLRDVAEPVVVDGGSFRLSRQEIRIPEEVPFRGELLGGTYRVTGEMGLERFRPTGARLEVWSHNLQYRLADTANVTFDTDVQLRADDVFKPETYVVSGVIDILDGRYYRDMSLVNQQITGRVIDAFSGRTRRYQANPLSQMPSLREIVFDLQIRARDGVAMQNQVDRFQLDLEMRMDLRLQQTLNDPRMTGEVKVVDGAVGFQGERFEVSEGTLTYRGSVTNPHIDIRAGADIDNRCVDRREFETMSTSLSFAGDFDRNRQSTYHILLNAEGPVDNMNIEMESNPYADQRDILSLMLTGCTVDELTASSASQPTLEIALGPLLGRLEKQVKDVVELSEFSIMPGVERTEVRIGDEVTRRLRWNFQLDTGMSEESGGQRYQLEYRLSEQWSAEFSERSLNETENLLLDMRLKYRVPLGE